MVAIEAAARLIVAACDTATDCGCHRAFLASLVDVIDQHRNAIAAGRDDLAAILGWPRSPCCTATICSSHWNQETAGSDAGGKEPQRSGTKTDDAGASRSANRRRA